MMTDASHRGLMENAEKRSGSRDAKRLLHSFDASTIPLGSRLSEWQAFVSDHLAEADLAYPDRAAPSESFGGRIAVDRRESVRIGTVRSARQRLIRTPAHIRRAEREMLLLTLVSRGDLYIEQDGRKSKLGPGQSCVYSSRRPYQIDVPGELDATIVMVERSVIDPIVVDRLESFCARAADAGDPIGDLGFGFWKQLGSKSVDIDDAKLNRLVKCGLDLVEAELPSGQRLDRTCSHDLALQRARFYITTNLASSHLTPAKVARAAGLSLRRVQELFQADGTTMTAFVRTLRLDAAYRTLEDRSMRKLTIASVAAHHGFTDQSRFNREFRVRFGTSPGLFRRQHFDDA